MQITSEFSIREITSIALIFPSVLTNFNALMHVGSCVLTCLSVLQMAD